MPGSRGQSLLHHLLPALFLLVAFLVFILRNWHIKAYSDPMAWLNTAKAFPGVLAKSDLPLGYPAFLWLALKITGPFYVFLANLPVLSLLVLLIGGLAAAAARETEPTGTGAPIGILAAALVLGFDPELLVYMTNPYRDPLSYVLLVGSLLLLMRYAASPTRDRLLLALSGLLLGLAYCVREPSLLALGPMFILGFLHERKSPGGSLVRAIFTFGAGLLAGALPLLYQTFVLRQQVSISPYSASRDTLLPGLHAVAFPATVSKAGAYFLGHMGWIPVLLLLSGLALALHQRNRAMPCLALLSALYAVFYGFYWMFSKRYFFSVVLGGAPLVAFGAYGATRALLRAARRPGWTLPVFRWIVLLFSLATGVKLLAAGGADRPFRAPQARQFVQALEKAVPPGGAVFCERPLSDVIRTLTDRTSSPLGAHRAESPAQAIEAFEAIRASGRPTFFMKTVPTGKADPDEALLRRRYDLELAADFPADEYRIENFNFGNPATLYRILPWSQTETKQTVAISSPAILQINAGDLWRNGQRTTAQLWIGDSRVLDRVENGVSFVEILPAAQVSATISLRSDQPVPLDFSPVLLPLDAPLDLDVGELSRNPYEAKLSPEFFQERAHNHHARRIKGRGTVELPLPWREPMTVFAEFSVKSAGEGQDAKERIGMSINGGEPVASKIAHDGRYHSVIVSFAHDGQQTTARTELAGAIDLDRIYLHPARAAETWTLDVGSAADAPFLPEGFYSREKAPDGSTARWTAPRARVNVFLAHSTTERELQIEYADIRPAAAPAPDVALSFNGQPLSARDETHPANPGHRILRAPFPPEAVRPGENQLELLCRTWNPGDLLKNGDTRDLGIFVDAIRVVPRPAAD
ncbi:MAG TPA: hypothetical protein DCM68_08685 [Verrucomicrobia bacterium]|nr:hypothetical protein [Verrucomicrobiota bacterium]